MKVRAIVSFVGHIDGSIQPWPIGKEGELPPGVDWMRIGWVVPVEAADGELEAEPEIVANVPEAKIVPAKQPRKRSKKA